MVDVHGMCILHTFLQAGSAYFGAQGQATRPDYIAIPQGLRVHTRVPRDHVPPVSIADIIMPNIFTILERTSWDYDNMACSLQTGAHRREFTELIQADLTTHRDML
eukprot:2635253-Pyramimonas_sp.AAC.1